MFMDPKAWYQSKTILGAIVALLAGVAGIAGYTVSEVEQSSLLELLLSVGSAAGGLLAWYGRIKASRPIGPTPPGGTLQTFAMLCLLGLVVSILTGCAAMSGFTDPVHQAPTAEQAAAETPAEKAKRLAHSAIDEANVALLALGNVIDQNIDAQFWTKAQAQAYQDKKVDFGKKVDAARELLRLGDPAGAQSQAEAVRRLIIELQRKAIEVAGQRSALEIPILI